MRSLILAALLWLASPLTALADAASDIVSVRVAVALAQAGDWVEAEAAVAGAGPVARDVIRWQRLRGGGSAQDGLELDDYAAFVREHPHWPGLERLRREGEALITPRTPPEAVAQWFAGAGAQTGRGAQAHAQALQALGRGDEARDAVRSAWLSLGLSIEEQAALIVDWGPTLAPLHQARVEAMLWRQRTGDAERLLPHLEDGQRALALVRIALIRQEAGAAAQAAELPGALADDPGLARDLMNRLFQQGRRDEAAALILERSAGDLGQPLQWASRRADLARWLLREGRPDEALALAAAHQLAPEGDAQGAFAELEWLAGRAALQGGEAATAREHFLASEAAAISAAGSARAAFWAGRAAEAAGDSVQAVLDHARGAEIQITFYGLLSAEYLGEPLDPRLYRPEGFGEWRDGAILSNDLLVAMLLLQAAGEVNDAVLFAMKLGQTLPQDDLGQLGALLDEAGAPHLLLAAAKEAAARGVIIPAMLFPLHPLSRKEMPVAPDLALAVARQESAFNAGAGSGAGALGLMQLMPATAEEVARRLGLPWERARLTADWDYNATLGTDYLAGLERMFGASPVLVAAGYNAGPSRPRQWITERGDPRRGEVDPVDWIEDIPFTETRDYVMRVLEGIPVYRARLTGAGDGIGLQALIVGAPPLVRPRARPEPPENTGPRPQARPGTTP